MRERIKRPVRFFNTTGPCNPWDHYMLPPEERLVGAQLHRYVRDNLYWVLHAPRQTGKTTFLQSWMTQINAGTEAVACYVSVERCQGLAAPERAMPSMCEAIYKHAKENGLAVPSTTTKDPASMVNNTLIHWAELTAPKPLVVLFDEADVLTGDTLISFLRQLQDGFAGRGVEKFPTSIALVGMRDLKDYITAAKGGVQVNPGSPFNIKEDSSVIKNFTQEDVGRLFAQRIEETGQGISHEALEYTWEQSQGQPWIVNSLFKRATMRVLEEKSRETVSLEHIGEARRQMILARETHLDALTYRLEDPRIRRVIETLMTGEPDPNLAESEGFRLCEDLGLVTRERGTPRVANLMYREVLARQMTFGTQTAIPEPEWQWERTDGTLDMEALMREFQKFWRRHSELWEQKSNYTEAFPHLLLMAFLQRVISWREGAMDGAENNAGGVCESKLQYSNRQGSRFEYKYATGRGRMDLCVEYHGRMYVIEIKLIRDYTTPEEVMEEGLEQIRRYRDRLGGNPPAYLVIFDRREEAQKVAWENRLGWEVRSGVTVVRY